MGNTESAKKKQQRKELLKQMEKDSQKTGAKVLKRIVFLHNSDTVQSEVVENFYDALGIKTAGTLHVTNFINIANGTEIPKGRAWLDELNNVVLICLTSESIEHFTKIMFQKGFADQNGQLHSKVFSVTFGESLTSKWPSNGLKKGSTDLRDFHFGFSDVENIRQQDFERSPRMNSLIAAIKVTR